LEATYQNQLRNLEAPVIQSYQRELERLKQTYTMQGRTADVATVDAELARLKKSPVLSYDPKPPPPPPGTPPPDANKPKPPPGKPDPNTIVLTAKDATTTPATPDAGGNAVALGSAAWNVARLPAGDYEIRVLYACAKMDPGKSMSASIAGNQINRALGADLSTNSDQNFRLLRLGKFTLDKDARELTVTLQVDPPGPSSIFVRSVMLAHPKPKP
jgi:hypothetical protein